MSGWGRNDEKVSKEEEGGGGGWASLWKVAGAVAAAVEAGGSSGAAHTNEGAAAVWTKPKGGWVKLNVDGSLRNKGEIPSAGCGGVIRNASGIWLYGFAQKLSPSLREDEVEKEAILRGLQWAAHGKGVRKLVVESDREGTVDKVNNGSRSNEPLIRDIRKLLNSPHWEATLTWIPRDANKVADKLADIARSFTSFDLKEIDSAPENCLTALEKDSKAKEAEGEGGGGGGEGWASMLLKIGGAAVAAGVVAGGLYNVLKQPDQEGAAVWTKPKAGWVKLNVDGSLLPETPSAGCGGVLRDSSGKWMDGFAQKLSPGLKVDETEKEGILRGLQWARGKGVKKLVVESDNEGVVYTVNSGFRSTDPLICDIRELLNNRYIWEATLTRIRREANQVADKVAYNSHALTSFDQLHEYGPHSPPRNCLYALSRDAQ